MPPALLDGVLDHAGSVGDVFRVGQVEFAQTGAVRGHENLVVRHAPGGPHFVAVGFDDPYFVAVGDRHGLAGLVPAVFVDQVTNDLYGLAGGAGAFEGDVLNDMAVHHAESVGFHDFQHFFAAFVVGGHRHGRFAHGQSLVVEERVAAGQILIGLRNFGDFADHAGIVAGVAAFAFFEQKALSARFMRRGGNQVQLKRVRHGVAGMRNHGVPRRGRILSDAKNGAAQSRFTGDSDQKEQNA